MLKTIALSAALLISLGGDLRALDEIDRSVLGSCENRCNGENTDCINCYTESVDLWRNPFEYPNADPEADDSDDDDPYGNVGFKF